MAPCGGDVLDGAVVAVLPALDAHAGVLRGSLHDLAVMRRRCVRCSAVVARRSPRWSRLRWDWWSWSGRGMKRGCGRSTVRHVPHARRENQRTRRCRSGDVSGADELGEAVEPGLLDRKSVV